LLNRLLGKYYALQHRFWSVAGGAEIHLHCRIGGGLLLPHPNGIVIHPGATIGVNCTLFQQVTLGTRTDSGVPVLGNDVLVGAGAKILGPVMVGDHARIGANAVVLTDVPTSAHAVGVPARISSPRGPARQPFGGPVFDSN
jgi:serine O-acetyltransferase